MSSCLMFGKCNRGWSDAYDLAHKLGKSMHLCELQKIYAYLADGDIEHATISLNIAKSNIPNDSYYQKCKIEIERLERKINQYILPL